MMSSRITGASLTKNCIQVANLRVRNVTILRFVTGSLARGRIRASGHGCWNKQSLLDTSAFFCLPSGQLAVS